MGSPAGRADLRAENRALRGAHTITIAQNGAAWIDADQGDPPGAEWVWSAGRAPAGFVHARVSGTIEASHGRVVWMRVVLRPDCRFNDTTCMDDPLDIIDDRAGLFYAYGTAASHTCFGPARGAYLRHGESLLGSGSDFATPRVHGSEVTFSYHTRFGGHTVTETDTTVRSTGQLRRSVVVIPKRRDDPAYTVRTSYRFGATEPPPDVNRCS